MYKFPENKIPPYNLCKKDKKIIEASINLGRFLLSLPECNFRQKKDIKRMLHFLTRLPLAPPKDFNYDFGFDIFPEKSNKKEPLNRSWSIGVSGTYFEIFSIYTIVNYDTYRLQHNPNFDLDFSLKYQKDEGLRFLKINQYEYEHEFSWSLYPGNKNKPDYYNMETWISEVSNPKDLVKEGCYLEIDTST